MSLTSSEIKTLVKETVSELIEAMNHRKCGDIQEMKVNFTEHKKDIEQIKKEIHGMRTDLKEFVKSSKAEGDRILTLESKLENHRNDPSHKLSFYLAIMTSVLGTFTALAGIGSFIASKYFGLF